MRKSFFILWLISILIAPAGSSALEPHHPDSIARRMRCAEAHASIFAIKKSREQKIRFKLAKGHENLIKPRYLKQIEKYFSEINEKIAKDFNLPPEVTIELSASGNAPYASLTKPEISISYRFGKFRKEPERLRVFPFELSKGAMAHEYGHVFIREFLFDNEKSLAGRVYQYKKLEKEAEENLHRLEEEFETADSMRREKILDERNAILKARRSDNSEMYTYSPFFPDLLAFEEFFADTFAVAMTKDGTAISRILEVGSDPNRGRLRDFTREQVVPVGQVGAHNILNVARHYVWANYLNQSRVLDNPGPVLRKIMKAVDSAMNKHLVRTNSRLQDYKEMNDSLIQELDRELQNYRIN